MNSISNFGAVLPLVTMYGMRLIGVLVAIWVSLKLATWLQQAVSRGLSQRAFDATLSLFFGNMVRWVVILMAALVCLSLFGIETTSFAAVIGAAGLAIGLAFQGTLSNFAAGVMLLVFRPFRVGDYVVAAGKEGLVAEIGIFSTVLDTLDNRRMYISNTAIGAGVIENFTAHPVRRVDIDVNIAGSESIEATRQALNAAGAVSAGPSAPREYAVFLKGFGGGMVQWQVRVWCETTRYWEVWELTVHAVAVELAKAKISMPTPAMNVSVSGSLGAP